MAEGRMAESWASAMARQIFVQPQHTGDGARDLRHFEAVSGASGNDTFMIDENLRLVGQAPKGR